MIVFDIDGTLSIVGDRLECLKDKDWDSFYARCGEDTVNEPIASVCRAMDYFDHVIYITGRRESCRDDTVNWIKENGLPWHPNHSARPTILLMRNDGDCRHDSVVKIELAAPFMDKITSIFEDRNSMVETWRNAGFTCLQVADGDF